MLIQIIKYRFSPDKIACHEKQQKKRNSIQTPWKQNRKQIAV